MPTQENHFGFGIASNQIRTKATKDRLLVTIGVGEMQTLTEGGQHRAGPLRTDETAQFIGEHMLSHLLKPGRALHDGFVRDSEGKVQEDLGTQVDGRGHLYVDYQFSIPWQDINLAPIREYRDEVALANQLGELLKEWHPGYQHSQQDLRNSLPINAKNAGERNEILKHLNALMGDMPPEGFIVPSDHWHAVNIHTYGFKEAMEQLIPALEEEVEKKRKNAPPAEIRPALQALEEIVKESGATIPPPQDRSSHSLWVDEQNALHVLVRRRRHTPDRFAGQLAELFQNPKTTPQKRHGRDFELGPNPDIHIDYKENEAENRVHFTLSIPPKQAKAPNLSSTQIDPRSEDAAADFLMALEQEAPLKKTPDLSPAELWRTKLAASLQELRTRNIEQNKARFEKLLSTAGIKILRPIEVKDKTYSAIIANDPVTRGRQTLITGKFPEQKHLGNLVYFRVDDHSSSHFARIEFRDPSFSHNYKEPGYSVTHHAWAKHWNPCSKSWKKE